MHDRRTWTSLVCWLIALGAIRCGPDPTGDLGMLPSHNLDLSRARSRDGRSYPAGQPRPEWAAHGYRPWRYIVIHHSASPRGNAATFDKWHRAKGWDELGYHFVIDNGDGGPDGRIEVGSRWRSQKWGAHCGGTPNNEYNNFGIGICLVGDFTRGGPSPKQLQSLQTLVTYLASRYEIPPERVIGHRDAPNASTACPGGRLHDYIYRTLRPRLARHLAIGK